MDRKEMKRLRKEFVDKPQNRRILMKISFSMKERGTLAVRSMVQRARKELGYSPSTIDWDILQSLYNQARRPKLWGS